MSIINIILVLIVVAVSASDFLLSKFKRKGIDGSVVLYDKKKNKSESKSSKFYTKSYFLIPSISLILFGSSFLFPEFNLILFEYSNLFKEVSLNPRDIVVLLSISIIYILFAFNSYFVKIKNEKKKAREVLFFVLNIFIILILFGSHLIIKNRNDFLHSDLEKRINKLYDFEGISQSFKNKNIYYPGGLDLNPDISFIDIKYFDEKKLNPKSLGFGLDDFQRVEIYESKFNFLFGNVTVDPNGFFYMSPIQYENYKKGNIEKLSNILGFPESLDETEINGLNVYERRALLEYNKLNFSFSKDYYVFGEFLFNNIKKKYDTSRYAKYYYLDSRYGNSFYYSNGWKGSRQITGSSYYQKTVGGQFVHASDIDEYENRFSRSKKSECEIWICETRKTTTKINIDVKYIPTQFELKYSDLVNYPTFVMSKDMDSFLKMILSNSNNNLSSQEIIDLFDKKVYLSHSINTYEVISELRESKYLLQDSIWNNINLGSISLAIFIIAYPLRFAIWILLAIISAVSKTIGWSIKTYFED